MATSPRSIFELMDRAVQKRHKDKLVFHSTADIDSPDDVMQYEDTVIRIRIIQPVTVNGIASAAWKEYKEI